MPAAARLLNTSFGAVRYIIRSGALVQPRGSTMFCATENHAHAWDPRHWPDYGRGKRALDAYSRCEGVVDDGSAVRARDRLPDPCSSKEFLDGNLAPGQSWSKRSESA